MLFLILVIGTTAVDSSTAGIIVITSTLHGGIIDMNMMAIHVDVVMHHPQYLCHHQQQQHDDNEVHHGWLLSLGSWS